MTYFTITKRYLRVVGFSLFLMLTSMQVHAESGFVLTDISGKQQRLEDFKGKWVLVNYWATWCPPCLEEVPDLVSLYDQRKDKDLVVLGIALDYKSKDDVVKFVDDMLMSYPIVLGNEKIIQQVGPADVLPTTYIYNPQGKLVKTKHGAVTKEYVEKIINAK